MPDFWDFLPLPPCLAATSPTDRQIQTLIQMANSGELAARAEEIRFSSDPLAPCSAIYEVMDSVRPYGDGDTWMQAFFEMSIRC